jgi:hypothetical protein
VCPMDPELSLSRSISNCIGGFGTTSAVETPFIDVFPKPDAPSPSSRPFLPLAISGPPGPRLDSCSPRPVRNSMATYRTSARRTKEPNWTLIRRRSALTKSRIPSTWPGPWSTSSPRPRAKRSGLTHFPTTTVSILVSTSRRFGPTSGQRSPLRAGVVWS